MDTDDTIAAIASPPGGALRGILRISGPNCAAVIEKVFTSSESLALNRLKTTAVLHGSIRLRDQAQLPGELLFWPTRRSYTRQPSAEFHTFGSPPLLKMALGTLCQSGARLAHPGEFTLRAFLSGRLDLTQAEAVLAVIDAQAETQLNSALQQLAGGLSGPLMEARDQLKFVLAELEAGLDFVEEDIEFIHHAELVARLETALTSLQQVSSQIRSRDQASEQKRIVLSGRPNAGKSSLFNSLLGTPRAIVTDIAGTTTDYLSATMEIDGLKIELIDTAGMEHIGDDNDDGDGDNISYQAQQQREFAQSNAQIQLFCIDGSNELTAWERERLAQLDKNSIIVQTKSDLVDATLSDLPHRNHFPQALVATSSRNSTGMETLLNAIRNMALELDNTRGEIVHSTVLRAADSLCSATAAIDSALAAANAEIGEEVVAAEIRLALNELGLVVGTVYTDDILDIVFSRFCIGK